jgi:hypothetical protein
MKFSPRANRFVATAVAIALLQSIQVSLKQLQLPTLSESLTALAQAQAGH